MSQIILEYKYDGEKVHITDFASTHLNYQTLNHNHNYNSLVKLWNLFNPELNANIHYYADGTHGNFDHTVSKIRSWGSRGENETPLRAFFVSKLTDDQVIGFINLGISTAKLQDTNFYEGGMLFNHIYNGDSLVTEAINSIYNSYLKHMHSKNILTAPGFIYTISPTNPSAPAFKESNLKMLELSSKEEDLENSCIIEALNNAGSRFNISFEIGKVFDNGREVEVFYNLLDPSLCSPVEKAGEIKEEL